MPVRENPPQGAAAVCPLRWARRPSRGKHKGTITTAAARTIVRRGSGFVFLRRVGFWVDSFLFSRVHSLFVVVAVIIVIVVNFVFVHVNLLCFVGVLVIVHTLFFLLAVLVYSCMLYCSCCRIFVCFLVVVVILFFLHCCCVCASLAFS